MCRSPKAPKVSMQKAEFLRNPFLDSGPDGAALSATRTGTSALRIPLDTGLGIGFNPRGGSVDASGTAGPQGNGQRQGNSLGGAGGNRRVGTNPEHQQYRGGGGGFNNDIRSGPRLRGETPRINTTSR